MDERIADHLKLLNKYTIYLKEIAQVSKEKYISDHILRASSERYLQLAIESCLNIGNRLLSIAQFSAPISTPETYADVFKEIGRLCDIPEDFVDKLVKIAKFRNMLVHLYWELEPEKIYQILQNSINDFERFRDLIVDCLTSITTGDDLLK